MTNVIAIIGAVTGSIGAVTGVVALIWQIETSRRSKHLVRVTISNDLPPSYEGRAGFMHAKVEAVNHGSDPVTVTGWGIGLPWREQAAVLYPVPLTTPLPHRLEGGDSVTFWMVSKDLRRFHEERGVRFSQMRGWVRLGTGQAVVSRRGLPIRD